MDKLTISMVIFHSYVSLPEGTILDSCGMILAGNRILPAKTHGFLADFDPDLGQGVGLAEVSHRYWSCRLYE